MNLEGYIPVDERLRRALDKYPDLRIRELGAEFVTTPEGDTILICTIEVGRSADDEWPTLASASEPYPGRTPYTRGSERMVGMTSALGRALGYMGFGIEAGIASANEIAARQGSPDAPRTAPDARKPSAGPSGAQPATDAQKRLLRSLRFAGDPDTLTKAQASAEIENLKKAASTEEDPF